MIIGKKEKDQLGFIRKDLICSIASPQGER